MTNDNIMYHHKACDNGAALIPWPAVHPIRKSASSVFNQEQARSKDADDTTIVYDVSRDSADYLSSDKFSLYPRARDM